MGKELADHGITNDMAVWRKGEIKRGKEGRKTKRKRGKKC
jgi:hypothetical protein